MLSAPKPLVLSFLDSVSQELCRLTNTIMLAAQALGLGEIPSSTSSNLLSCSSNGIRPGHGPFRCSECRGDLVILLDMKKGLRDILIYHQVVAVTNIDLFLRSNILRFLAAYPKR